LTPPRRQSTHRGVRRRKSNDVDTKCCLAVMVALHLSLWDATAQTRKVVIDCDPSIDDA
jgi:hypothetical protein